MTSADVGGVASVTALVGVPLLVGLALTEALDEEAGAGAAITGGVLAGASDGAELVAATGVPRALG